MADERLSLSAEEAAQIRREATERRTQPLPPDGCQLIVRERVRQIAEEGWTPEHDEGHGDGALLMAAFCYIGDLVNGPHKEPSSLWPWADYAWKPTPGDRIRQMVKAGALIAAEIDRLQRLAPSPENDDGD